MVNQLRKYKQKLKAHFQKNKTSDVEISYDQKRQIINLYREKYSCKSFVETGTFLGDTVWFFKEFFDELYSIELSYELAERAKKRFEDCANVNIIEGNSAIVLQQIIDKFNCPVFFWLDGHYSSEFFYKGEYFRTAKAEKNTPIEQELEIVLASDYDHIILIDDARLFVGHNDYPTIDEIREKVSALKNNYKVEVHTDIIQIFPV